MLGRRPPLCASGRHVAVARVAAQPAHGHVLALDGGDLVRGDGALRRLHVDPVQPRGVSPSGAPSGANWLFFCISTGTSSRRKASICHCGDPYQTESLPHTTWSAPRPRTRVPISAAASGGLATAQVAKDVPTSP